MYFSNCLLLSSGALFRQTKCILMITNEGYVKIVNFITPGGGVLMLERGHMCHHSKYAPSSTLSIYSTLIAVVLRDYNAAFQCHCWFWFILWWGCFMQIRAFLTKSQWEYLILSWPLWSVGFLFSLILVSPVWKFISIRRCIKHQRNIKE